MTASHAAPQQQREPAITRRQHPSCDSTGMMKLKPLLQRKSRYDSAEYNLLQEGKLPQDGIVLVTLHMRAAPLKETCPSPTANGCHRPSPVRLSSCSSGKLH